MPLARHPVSRTGANASLTTFLSNKVKKRVVKSSEKL
jgi:hypothetical protein